MRVCLIYPNLDGDLAPNLGLAYVLSSAKKEHDVRLIDVTFHVKDYASYVLDNLREFNPDVVGFSVTSFSFHHALKIASIIREAYPGVPLVYGGVHPTLLPEEALRNSLVDAVCIGEGEDSFKEYLGRIEAGLGPKGVAGIWYKDKQGAVIKNPLRPFREDLDSLPFPDWDYWDIDRYLKSNLYFVGGIGHIFSRGCPHSCTFCSSPAIRRAIPGKFYRTRNPENVIEEIKLNKTKYAKRGFMSVAFGDSTFGLDRKFFEKFCELYIKESLHVEFPWICQTRADLITEEWARLAAGAGCCMVILGIESGDDYIRTKVFRKDITRDDILNAVRILKKNDIMYVINVILGCPEETTQSVNNTINLLKIADPIYTFFSFYQPLPKTELGEMVKKSVIVDEDKLTKTWNTPRIAIKYIRIVKLKIMMLRIRIPNLYRFLVIGLKMEGANFIINAFRHMFSSKDRRKLSLFNPLEQGMLRNYIFYRWKKIHRAG